MPKVPKVIQKHIRHEDFSPKYREAVRSLHHRIDNANDEIGTKFWECVKDRKNTIEKLLDRAERLSKKLEGQSFPFVLCHSDIHAGNLLLEKEDVFYLVDWDDPIMAPRERNLMFIGGGVGNVWNRPHEEELFYEGYGKIELNPVLLSYYRHERFLEDIAEYAEMLLMQDRAAMYQQFVTMFEPNGVVDIALKGYGCET